MDMLDDRISRIALAVSLLLHTALVAPLWERWSPLAADTGVEIPPPPEPISFRLVDPQPGPEEVPEEPTPNLSDANRRAAQPDAPADLPSGEAFSEGRAPVPVVARPRENRAAADPGRTARATRDMERPTAQEADPVEESRPPPPDERGDPERTTGESLGRTDPRLALGPTAIASRPRAETSSGAPLPVPEVDQRLTRAQGGSAFTLNTTAWDFAPYMQRLKARIERHISPPAAFYYGTAAWVSRVRFRIAPDGRLLDVRLIDHRGVENLQYVALDAIQGAADYEPLPPDFPEPVLEITGNFYFNVFPSDER
jgi:hypothetical protein